MKHVWQCSTRAPIGTPAGPGSSTFVGQTSTQRLQPVQRSRTINSNMAGAPLRACFGPCPYVVEPADQQATLLLGLLLRDVFALVHAAALVAGECCRVAKASRGYDARGLTCAHGVRTNCSVMFTQLAPSRLEDPKRMAQLVSRAKHVLVERQDLVLRGFEYASPIHGFHAAART